MKKLVAKMRKVRMTRWTKLTLGEKALRVVMSLVKVAVIAAVGFAVAGVIAAVAAVAVGVVVALAIGNAVGGGLYDASRVRRPGERYIRFY